MHSHRNSDVNMVMNCEPLTDLSEGTGEEKEEREREGEKEKERGSAI